MTPKFPFPESHVGGVGNQYLSTGVMNSRPCRNMPSNHFKQDAPQECLGGREQERHGRGESDPGISPKEVEER